MPTDSTNAAATSSLNMWNTIVAWNMTNPYIDLIVFLLILAGGFFAKKYLTGLKWEVKYKVLLVGTAFTIIWMFLTGQYTRSHMMKYLISYTLATSFYELILGTIVYGLRKGGLGAVADELEKENTGDTITIQQKTETETTTIKKS